MNNSFYRFFPTPRFLEMPMAGLDISDESMHVVELSPLQKGAMLRSFAEKKIPKGVIESGEIKDEEAFLKVLTEFRNEKGLEFVNVSLPEEHAYVVSLRIPKMKRSEIRGNLELQLEDNVPLPLNEAVFDYDIISNDSKNNYIEVALSVFPRRIVDHYHNLLKKAGFVPMSFEIESQALAHAVVRTGDDGTFMIMDFGKTRTGISIVSQGVVHFTSTVAIGGASLTNAIAKTLGVSFEEAEKTKKKQGVTGSTDNDDLFLALMSQITILRDEIQKHYSYWQTHKDQYGTARPKIEKILLCGGDANLAGLPDYLTSGLSAPVELANVITNVNSLDDYIPPIHFSESLRYTAAIGLALSLSPFSYHG